MSFYIGITNATWFYRMLEQDQSWKLPPRDVRLQEREVHIWRASLTPYKQAIQGLENILSAEECTQATRFRLERDRQRWIVAHAILRLLLARYLGIDRSTLRFGMNAYGKPFLASPALTPPFQFNLSHAGDLVLYAFVYTAQVGIDVEYLRTDLDYEALARVSFSPWEQMTLRALPQERKLEAFFSCWTRKEAYIKARGLGLSLSLDLFDVSFIPGERPALLDSREDPHEITRWSLHELMPGMGYVGALALVCGGTRSRRSRGDPPLLAMAIITNSVGAVPLFALIQRDDLPPAALFISSPDDLYTT